MKPAFALLRLASWLVVAVAAGSLAPTLVQAATPASACAATEYHQLDFWIGDWNTFETDTPEGPSIARARIDPVAGGCALHERYEQTDGLVGDSILSYDPVRKQWQQTWVTNRGSIMLLWGNFANGALVLEGEVHLQDGKTVLQRITWKTQGQGVRESAVISKDGGKTWAPAFDVLFLKRSDEQESALPGATHGTLESANFAGRSSR